MALVWINDNMSEVLSQNFSGKFPHKSSFVIMGESAGGHLAVVQALKRKKEVRIKGCVNLFGTLDVTNMLKCKSSEWEKFVEKDVLQRKSDVRREAKEELCPMQMINNEIELIPPVFTAHGQNDMLVPVKIGRVFHESLQKKREELGEKNNFDVFVEIEGARHGFGINKNPTSSVFAKANLQFVKRCFNES